jgi:hypothetical protein
LPALRPSLASRLSQKLQYEQRSSSEHKGKNQMGQMTYGHIAAVVAASIAAIAVLAAMIFGWNIYLDAIGVHRSMRDVAIALWSFLLPSWFTVEEAWFTPKDAAKLNDFRELQRKARLTWTIVAGAVGIIIGVTAPSGGPSPAHTTSNPPISVPSKTARS